MKIAFHCQLIKLIIVQIVLLMTDGALGQAATENVHDKRYQHDGEGSSRNLWLRSVIYKNATSALTTEEDTWIDTQYDWGDYEDPIMAIHGKKSRNNGDSNGKKRLLEKQGDIGKNEDNGKKGDNGKKLGADDDDGTAIPTVMKPTSTPTQVPTPTPMPTMSPTPVPTLVPTATPTPQCPPARAGPDCECFDASQLTAIELQDACNGLPERQECCQNNGCFESTNGIVCPNSCNGDFACINMHGFPGAGSCNGFSACVSMNGFAANGSCNGNAACAGMTGFAGAGSCNADEACFNMNGFVAGGSCNAIRACEAFSGFACQDSCNTASSCFNIDAYVEEGSEGGSTPMVDVSDCPSMPPTNFPRACINFDLCCEEPDTNACRNNFDGMLCP